MVVDRCGDKNRHYFLTYKEVPGESGRVVEIAEEYGRQAAHDVIGRSRADYRERFGDLENMLAGTLHEN